MLAKLIPKLLCVGCLEADSLLLPHSFSAGDFGHIRDGVLICENCERWYPIRGGVLELLRPEFFYPQDIAAFETCFCDELKSLRCQSIAEQLANSDSRDAAQIKQRRHFDDYAEGTKPGFTDFMNSPFWRAEAHRFLNLWRRELSKNDAWILDVGCGTGGNSVPLADRYTVIGFDISKKAILRATTDAEAKGRSNRTTFFVADGTRLPLKNDTFDYAQTFGALHHLPDPQQTIREILRVLRPGGIHHALEPNKTVFRGLFDFLMKINPLWIEQANTDPLMSDATVEKWLTGMPASFTSETSVFLPPQIFNLIGDAAARSLLEMVDRLCSSIPGLRRQGGVLFFMVRKERKPELAALHVTGTSNDAQLSHCE
jgi:ubiquinone/menaquinone biosynthesis C-methylase UbiE/uncharacterized protein YbaR (Trm112 family)